MIKIKRPILIIAIGYLIGIIYGLYFNISIAFTFGLIYILSHLICKIKKKILSKGINRYIKIFVNAKIILVFCISAIISNTYILYINSKYSKFYENIPNIINAQAVIISEREEKEYSYQYIIKIKEGRYKNKRFILSIKKDEKNILEYGDLIKLEGDYIAPQESRNYKGFNYREYLKTKKVFGIIKADNIKILEHKKTSEILIVTNNIRNSIISKSKQILPDKTSNLLIGILLGNKSEISKEVLEDFKTSNLSHILSVSGMHTSYIVLGITYILSRSKVSKRCIYIFTIIFLIFFMFITNFTASVIRACIMGILMIVAKIFYCKTDFATSISISLLLTLIFNPFLVNEIGLQLSYLGTIGIILFNQNIEEIFCKIKFNNKLSKILSVTVSAQIMIIPIMALKFNTFSLTFFISNTLVTPFLGIIMILGYLTIFASFISYNIAKLLAVILNFSLEGLINISHFTSKLPFSKILIKTPYTIAIIFIYFFILSCNYIFTFYYSNKALRLFQRKIMKSKNIIKILKFISIILILFFVFQLFNQIFFSNLKIYFIDVGQGDSTLIITPQNKKILIDGGEGNTSILLNYLLDRRIKTIDYIMISHFDSDHCNGLIEIIEELNVKNIIISKQAYQSEEYINIAKIINEKKINVIYAKQNRTIIIDKNVKMDILYPTEELDYEDLNNNSIVAKVSYYNFSILFTRRYRKI